MEHISNWIQLVFMMSVDGMLVVVCVILSLICSDFYPLRALAVGDGCFPEKCPIYWQQQHMKSASYLPFFPGTILIFFYIVTL